MKKLIISILLLSCLEYHAQDISIIDTLNNFGYLASDSTIISELERLHYYVDPEDSPEAKTEIENGPEIFFDPVAYSTDSTIRLFRYYWENCGAYCFESDVIILASNDSINHQLNFLELSNELRGKIDSIKIIEEGKYIVFNHSWIHEQGGGNARCLSTSLISAIAKTELLWVFNIYSYEHDEEAILNLTYDDKTKMIKYRYKFHEYDKHQTEYIKTGNWLFSNGNFNIQNEKTVYFKK